MSTAVQRTFTRTVVWCFNLVFNFFSQGHLNPICYPEKVRDGRAEEWRLDERQNEGVCVCGVGGHGSSQIRKGGGEGKRIYRMERVEGGEQKQRGGWEDRFRD